MSEKRILIDVSGGLVQEVFMTKDDGTKIFLVDWDNIKEGDIDSSPWSKWDPVVLTPDEFTACLKEAETRHAERRTCQYCNTSLLKDGKIVHDEAHCPEFVWRKNEIQFPRLLAEINAMGLTETQKFLLARSMDLDPERVDEILSRAEAEFETWKKEAAPDASNTTD